MFISYHELVLFVDSFFDNLENFCNFCFHHVLF
jgi:hypothetical protein